VNQWQKKHILRCQKCSYNINILKTDNHFVQLYAEKETLLVIVEIIFQTHISPVDEMWSPGKRQLSTFIFSYKIFEILNYTGCGLLTRGLWGIVKQGTIYINVKNGNNLPWLRSYSFDNSTDNMLPISAIGYCDSALHYYVAMGVQLLSKQVLFILTLLLKFGLNVNFIIVSK